MTDVAIIRRFKEGDEGAKTIIYERVYKPLFHYAEKLVSDTMKAEDMVQDSFVKFIERKNNNYKYDNLKELMNILYEITRNTCLDHIRKCDRENKGKSEYRLMLQETVQLEDTLNVESEYARLIEVIMRAIPQQPEQRKQVLEYMLIHGKNAREIALLMDIHVSGIYKHRDAFKEYLQNEEGIDPNVLPWPSE